MSDMAKKTARRTFHSLDGMRGLAALAVVTHHAGWMFGFAYMQHAYMAVDLFFVLSGFVLAHAYERRFEAGLSALQFMKLRLIRLYPLYIVGVAIAAAWVALNLMHGAEVRLAQAQPWTWGQLRTALLHSAAFMPTPSLGAGPPGLYPLNIPAWSLLFEIGINLAFALVALRLDTRALTVLVVIAGALAAWLGLRHGSLNAGWAAYDLEIATVRVVFGFFAGVLIYRVSARVPVWLKVPPLVLLTIMIAAFMWLPSGKALAGYDVFCALGLFPALVLLGANTEPGRWTRPAYSFGGVTSYAVYAIHYPLCFVATVFFAMAGYDSAAHAPWSGMIFIAALLVLAWGLDRYYDAPLRAWLVRQTRPQASRETQLA